MRALSRALSLVEDSHANGAEVVDRLFPLGGKARVIGLTGAPGAGKSTLVDKLAISLIAQGRRVAILAVDPSSPFSGGAILGDRIRMVGASAEDGIFIRSAASRGALGGLSPRSADMIAVLDAAGFDDILVETVGVGQGEVEIVRTADLIVVVLVPGMGDGVQALKAGILEIADLFVINKADYPGVDRLAKELTVMMGLGEDPLARRPIVETVATETRGIAELVTQIDSVSASMEASGLLAKRRSESADTSLRRHLLELLSREAEVRVNAASATGLLLERLHRREVSPGALAAELLK